MAPFSPINEHFHDRKFDDFKAEACALCIGDKYFWLQFDFKGAVSKNFGQYANSIFTVFYILENQHSVNVTDEEFKQNLIGSCQEYFLLLKNIF